MSIETANIEAVYAPKGLKGLDACDYCGAAIAPNIVKMDRLAPGWMEVKNGNIREPRLVFDGEAVYCKECYQEDRNGCLGKHANEEA